MPAMLVRAKPIPHRNDEGELRRERGSWQRCWRARSRKWINRVDRIENADLRSFTTAIARPMRRARPISQPRAAAEV
jgi:hypothetical protein